LTHARRPSSAIECAQPCDVVDDDKNVNENNVFFIFVTTGHWCEMKRCRESRQSDGEISSPGVLTRTGRQVEIIFVDETNNETKIKTTGGSARFWLGGQCPLAA